MSCIDRRRLVSLLLLGCVGTAGLGGCAAMSSQSGQGTSDVAHRGDPVGRVFAAESHRDRLNDGYSSLYSQLQGLSEVDKIFYVKIESDDVQHVVEDLTRESGALAKRLDHLTADYPALDIHRTTTPPIIQAAHKAQRNGTLKQFAPLVGQSGHTFERGLLIRLLGAADQQRYLTATLADEETDPALAEIMRNASTGFSRRFDEINALLKSQYYQ